MPFPVLAGIGLGIQGISSVFQFGKGRRQEKQAQRALNEFEFQDLENAYEDIPISTLGSDLIREESARTTSSVLSAARGSGIRGLLGALPAIQSQNNNVNRQAQLDLDNQAQQRNRLIAQDNQNIRAIQEQRDRDELQGIGNLLNTGQQNSFSGLRGLANVGLSAASNFGGQGAGAAQQAQGTISKVPTSTLGLMSPLPSVGSMATTQFTGNNAYNQILQQQQEQALFNHAVPQNYGF